MGFKEDFQAALAQKRPTQVQETDPERLKLNLQRALNGQQALDTQAPVDSGPVSPNQRFISGPAVQSEQEQMAGSMAAQNQAQAATDPMMAARLAAANAAVQKYRTNQEAPQVDKLQEIEDEKKKQAGMLGQSYPATE